MKAIKLLYLTMIFAVISCGQEKQENDAGTEEPSIEVPDADQPDQSGDNNQGNGNTDISWNEYKSESFDFKLKYPDSWQKLEKNDFNALIFYDNNDGEVSPGLNADRMISQVALYPKGLGTELPFGKQINLNEYQVEAPVSFGLNTSRSKIFLLENEQVWAYFLVPQNPPEGWNEDGFLFIQIKVNDYRAECFNKDSGKKISMEECDPMAGDEIKKFGEVDGSQKDLLRKVMQSIQFTGGKNTERPISDLIQIATPQKNQQIRSPLTVEGKARGYWYFEGDFPVVLVDGNDQKIATGIAQAQSEWMTEEFVNFKLTLTFEQPNTKNGYLIFKRSNPSGLPKNDRSYRILVKF